MGENDSLKATTETKDEMESSFLLDVVVLEGTTVFELLASEDPNAVDPEEYLPCPGSSA